MEIGPLDNYGHRFCLYGAILGMDLGSLALVDRSCWRTWDGEGPLGKASGFR